MMPRALLLSFLMATLFTPTVAARTWIEGEMGYRVTAMPKDSPGARHGLRIGDILSEPDLLPQRLQASPSEGIEIPLYRLDQPKGRYEKSTIRIRFLPGEEKRLGLTGDIGFLVTAVRPGSLGARAELQRGDFISKINETFVHAETDLKLVDEAYEKGEQVFIYFTRWYADSGDFKNAVSRRRFGK